MLKHVDINTRQPLYQTAEAYGVSRDAFYKRISRGSDAQEAALPKQTHKTASAYTNAIEEDSRGEFVDFTV